MTCGRDVYFQKCLVALFRVILLHRIRIYCSWHHKNFVLTVVKAFITISEFSKSTSVPYACSYNLSD